MKSGRCSQSTHSLIILAGVANSNKKLNHSLESHHDFADKNTNTAKQRLNIENNPSPLKKKSNSKRFYFSKMIGKKTFFSKCVIEQRYQDNTGVTT